MSDPLDQPLDLGPDESRPPLDLDRVIGAPEQTQPEDLPLFNRDDDVPLITGPLQPARAARRQARHSGNSARAGSPDKNALA